MSSPPMASEEAGRVPVDIPFEAKDALTQLGQGLRRVLEAVRPGPLGPRDLQDLLGLHKTLAWRVLQIAAARDPLGAVPHVPGEVGMEKFLQAASRRGVDAAVMRPVREAFVKYRSLAKGHAGDRASFDVMLLSAAGPAESAVELRAARRAAYRSAGYTWGVQTAVRTLTAIVTPVGSEGVDLATVRCQFGSRRLRREGVLRLQRTVEHDTDKPEGRRVRVNPIEPEGVMGGVPLLKGFCTSPLPALEAVELADGNVEYRYVDQPLGDRASVTLCTGEVRRGLLGARWRNAENSTNAIMLTANVPMGLAVIDVWSVPGSGLRARSLVVSAAGVDALR
ncbi:MAG: hypothetical protein K2Q09_06125, partial [Phycisphaerales bacterium]|nr:hypothetical protein [Phycisphaerales bacterium]